MRLHHARFPLRRPRRLALAAMALLLGGCSARTLVDVLTPTGGYHVEKDLAYGPDPRQRFDLYRPDEPKAGAPVIVFFYGGNWDSGSKDLYPFVGQAFAAKGFTVAVPDYRLFPQVGWRGFLSDGAAAVADIRHRLDEGSGAAAHSPGIVLAGHSAGAYIAAMLALDESWLKGAGVPRCRIAAALGLAGPYDFLPLESDRLRTIFGPGPAGPATQPITHASRDAPPMLLLTGSGDTTVKPGNTERLAARLRMLGAPVETKVYEGLGHVQLVAAMAGALRFLAPVRDDAVSFLDRLPGQGANPCGMAEDLDRDGPPGKDIASPPAATEHP